MRAEFCPVFVHFQIRETPHKERLPLLPFAGLIRLCD